jgi:hypothetical protein
MERLDPLKIAHISSLPRNSFLFSIAPGPGGVYPTAILTGGLDAAALHMIDLIARALTAHGFAATQPKLNRTRQACTTVALPNSTVALLMGAARHHNHMFFLLLTWERTPRTKAAASTNTADIEQLRSTIAHILADELRVESLERMAERDAAAAFSQYE